MARWSGLRGLLVVCALVAGMFAMHGLAQHGDHLPTVASAPHAGHDSTVVAAPAAPLAGVTLAADPAETPDPADGSGALALCLTVLVAACLAVGASGRPRGGVLRTLSRAMTPAPPLPVRARAADPPDRWVLSVCRC